MEKSRETKVSGVPAVKLSSSELSAFCAQTAMILKAGISVHEGITIMLEDAENRQAQGIMQSIQSHVELGEPFSYALEQTTLFPKYMMDMVAIGEQSGRLDEVLESLANYYEREEMISKNIKSAVTYPLIMIGMMVLVIGVLLVKVLPIFNQVFVQLGSEMSGLFQGMLRFGTVLGQYSALIIGAMLLLMVLAFVMGKTDNGKRRLNQLQHGFFGTRKFSSKTASGRFAAAMALMLSSGLDTDQSLEMAQKLVDHPGMNSKITSCRNLISQGASFSDALAQAGVFTGVYARMIHIGFKTGSVDAVMRKISQSYDEEVNEQVERMISILEPTLVAILSIIVGMILLSVMLPLMGIMSSIG